MAKGVRAGGMRVTDVVDVVDVVDGTVDRW